jgi:hypothetical protein
MDRVVFGVTDRSELDAAQKRLERAGHVVERSGDELVVRNPDGIELRFVHR